MSQLVLFVVSLPCHLSLWRTNQQQQHTKSKAINKMSCSEMALLMHECAVAVELPRAASGHRVRYQMELVIGDAAIGTQSNNNMKQSTSQPVSHSIPIKYAQ